MDEKINILACELNSMHAKASEAPLKKEVKKTGMRLPPKGSILAITERSTQNFNDTEEAITRKYKRMTAEKSKDPKILSELAKDNFYSVRRIAAKNFHTTPEDLDALSNDEEVEIRAAVAFNPNTSIETLNKLKNDPKDHVRFWLAKNKNCPIDVLNDLSHDDKELIRDQAQRTLNESSILK